MTSFGYRLNPRYAIKECLSCGALYTGDFCCSKGNVEDKILVPKLLKKYERKFNRYSFFETPKVLLLAWDKVFKIKDALGSKQYKPDDTQELFHKLSNDVQNIHEELADDDDSLYKENIEYVEASPHDSKLVSLEATEIVIPEVKEIEDDNLREKLLNVHLLIANIEALKDNPTPSSKLLTKSSSTSPKSFLEETNTFHNSLPELENFCFDLEEISSG
nr:hypothetical protein [Tanacetum cinerariifolium]